MKKKHFAYEPMDVPLPRDEAFIVLARKELAAAEQRCLEMLNPPRQYYKTPRKPMMKTPRKPVGKTSCKVCGCHIDDYTPGCKTCTARHSMRRKSLQRREAA